MNADIEFLTIFSEICLGTTAFFAIVATLRQTLGEALTDYQYLITRYFIDVGLMLVFVSIAGMAVYAISDSHALAWQVMAWGNAIAAGTYIPYYLARRRKVITPGSKTAVFVMVLSFASWVNVVLALLGIGLPIPTAAMLHFVLTYACMLLVFVIFIGSFMKHQEITAE